MVAGSQGSQGRQGRRRVRHRCEEFECKLGVLGHDICGQVIVAVFAVEQEEVSEGFGWERRVAKEEAQFVESVIRIIVHADERLVWNKNRGAACH